MESIGTNLAGKKEMMQRNKETTQEIIEKYGQTLYERVQENFSERLMDNVLGKMQCPLLRLKEWDCWKMKLRKGEESWCKNIEYVNCPSYQANVNYWAAKRKEKARRV